MTEGQGEGPGSLDAASVYRWLSGPVLGYLRAQRAPEPEDLVGEVFLQVARDLGKFRGDDDDLRRWVFTLAHHRLVDERRRRARRPPLADAEVPDCPGPARGELPDPELAAALDALTADQREVVLLRFVADLSLETVAGITKRKVGAVKALQHRALENLRRAVSSDG